MLRASSRNCPQVKSSQPRRCCFLGVSSRRLSIRFRQRRWRAKVTCKVAAFAFQHFQYRILSLFFERDLESKISDPIFAQQRRRAGASAPRRPCLQCRKRMLIKSSLPCRDLAFPTPNAAFSGSPPPPLPSSSISRPAYVCTFAWGGRLEIQQCANVTFASAALDSAEQMRSATKMNRVA